MRQKDLPRTGAAFRQLVEPGSGLTRDEAIVTGQESAEESAEPSFDTRYALRLGPDTVIMVQDSGRWQPGEDGSPRLVRGQLRADPASSTRELLPALVKARSDLLIGIQNDINAALGACQTCTLIVGSLEGGETDQGEDLGRMLRPMMRRTDRFATLGPHRFALILASCPVRDAESAMARLAGLLRGHPGHSFLRMGAASSPDHTFQATKLLRFAEQALEAASRSDMQALVHTVHPAKPAPSAADAADRLAAALNDRRVVLACRSVVDAHSRAASLTQACPALAGDDNHPTPLGLSPNSLDAETALLLDARMMELAADHLAVRPQERLALPVSESTLNDPEWLTVLAAHLGVRPGIASRLMIEIPEAALSAGLSVRGRLDAMKALGVGLTVGGFGNGHAAMDLLRLLPVDLLKIDGVFIQPLKRSTDDRLFVRTLIDMAQHLGIATAAEWVDDDVTARLLATWGVDYMQGAAFGEWSAARAPLSLQDMRTRASARG
jgi:EAL domain-containing protein (putative c-di-GMP-specific phosphodiesterase class I)